MTLESEMQQKKKRRRNGRTKEKGKRGRTRRRKKTKNKRKEVTRDLENYKTRRSGRRSGIWKETSTIKKRM